MRVQIALGITGLVLFVASCQNPMAPPPADATRPAVAIPGVNLQTGPSNVCRGETASGIASTWPWAHDNKAAFPPPPGAIALWVKEFGPEAGVSSVRELLELLCTDGA